MSEDDVSKFVEDLLRGRRSERARPDEFEAAQMRAAIELRAARPGSGAPSEEFLTDLRERLGSELPDEGPVNRSGSQPRTSRRQVIGGASIAAAAAFIGGVADRKLLARARETPAASPAQPLEPVAGEWRPVAASTAIPEGATHAFDVGPINGFVHRAGGQLSAVSGVCTHQGCKLWFDAPDDRLRCPCHSTSFAVTGELLSHQLPQAPRPLPEIKVRESGGAVEVFAPTEQA